MGKSAKLIYNRQDTAEDCNISILKAYELIREMNKERGRAKSREKAEKTAISTRKK